MGGYQRGGPNNESDINESITDESSAELVKSVIVGEADNGTYYNVGVDGDGDFSRLQVESRDSSTYTIFNDILKELKKINMHLSIQNGMIIKDSEIE
jgi:hypothetical protein